MSEEQHEQPRPPEASAEKNRGLEAGEQELRPQIYVASLADYNAGRLHGRWIDAARSADELREDIAAMLSRSPEPIAEEWAIHDFVGFEGVRLDEYEDLEVVATLARGISEVGPAYAAWAVAAGRDLETLARFEDAYLGTWDSVTEYAEELLDGIGATAELARLPEWLQPHVKLDVKGFARDLIIGGDISLVEDRDTRKVHIFDGRA